MKPQKKRTAKAEAKVPAPAPGKTDKGIRGMARESAGLMALLPREWRHDWVLGFCLVVVTVFAYQPAWNAGTIWDDDKHITLPKLRSLEGLARIWIEPGAVQQYYPLVHSVFWVEHRLWGDASAPYHWVNILLHSLAALLVARILRELKIPGAWLAAGFFALHPVEVESVAWITELKNTLSAVFYLSAALAYLGFDRNRNRGNYAAALGLFLLGLMCKTVTASLPGALLVIFWWQRGKLSWKRDALPAVPFFSAGAGAGLFTAWVERKFIGAEGSEFHFSIVERLLMAGRVVWFYLGKLFWPVDLAFVYPRWEVSQAVWWQYLFPLAGLALAGMLAALAWRRGWRGPLAGLLFFGGTLLPAFGFVNVYPFRFSLVADHFQYLASLGPLTLAAAGIASGAGLFRKPKPWLESAVGAALLAVLGLLTWKQCGMYANPETLWRTTLRLNPKAWLAHHNLGVELDHQGRAVEAIEQFQQALEIKPDYLDARFNLGTVYFQMGRINEARTNYQKVVELQPRLAAAHQNLARCYFLQGQMREAISENEKAIEIQPDYPEAQKNLAWALATSPEDELRNGARAVELAERANQRTGGGNPQFLCVLAAARAEVGRFAEAVETAELALRLAEAQSNATLARQLRGQLQLYLEGRPYHRAAH